MAGGHCFPPLGCSHQQPRSQYRQRLLRWPPPPRADRIVSHTRCARASWETCCHTMRGFGHPGTLPKGGRSSRSGQVISHLHPLVLVAVTRAQPHPPLLVALRASVDAARHAPWKRLNHQGPLAAIAHGKALPDLLTRGLAPGCDRVPQPLGRPPPAPLLRGLGCASPPRRVRRYRQPRTLSHSRKAAPQPGGRSPLVVP
jgi:hypothetical protein